MIAEKPVIVCWGSKGGVGTTTVSALIALALARAGQQTTLVDWRGDLPLMLGGDGNHQVGLYQWLQAGDDVPAQGLHRLCRPIGERLELFPAGAGDLSTRICSTQGIDRQIDRLLAAFADRWLVVDAGVVNHSDDIPTALIARAGTSLLILRSCYLALHHAVNLKFRGDGVILIDEVGRAFSALDIQNALDVPVVASVNWDASLARSVDSGRLSVRTLRRARSLDSYVKALARQEAAREEVAHAT